MLVGEYKHTLDAKNRIFVPAKLREVLGEKFIICKNLYEERCLTVYTLENWAQTKLLLDKIPNSNGGNFKRFIFRSIIPATPDSQGRITLSQDLCDYAMLNNEEGGIITVGCGDYGEIWSKKLLDEISADETPAKYKDLLSQYGL